MVRVKFECIKTTTRPVDPDKPLSLDTQFIHDAELEAVFGGSPENDAFWQWTPSGHITISTTKASNFQFGKTYFVDFTEAPTT